MKTKEEILRKVCNYKENEELMSNDDITIEEAIDAMEQYAIDYHESKVKNLRLSDVMFSLPIHEIIGMEKAWPLVDVLRKLIEATEILLNDKDYDGHGWEEIHHCVVRGKEIVELFKGNEA